MGNVTYRPKLKVIEQAAHPGQEVDTDSPFGEEGRP